MNNYENIHFYSGPCFSQTHSVHTVFSLLWTQYCFSFRNDQNWTLYLCILKNVLLLIAVDVNSDCGPITARPAQSVDDSGTIREDYPQTL